MELCIIQYNVIDSKIIWYQNEQPQEITSFMLCCTTQFLVCIQIQCFSMGQITNIQVKGGSKCTYYMCIGLLFYRVLYVPNLGQNFLHLVPTYITMYHLQSKHTSILLFRDFFYETVGFNLEVMRKINLNYTVVFHKTFEKYPSFRGGKLFC